MIGTLKLPINGPPQQLAISPDGRTLAVSGVNLDQLFTGTAGASVGDLRFYDTRTHEARRRRLTDFGGARATTYSRDGSLLTYATQGAPQAGIPDFSAGDPLSIVVRDAHTLTLVRSLTFDPLTVALDVPDLARAEIMIAPDDGGGTGHRNLGA